MAKTILVDIGNTNMKFGLADHSGILQSFTLPTNREQTADSIGLDLAGMLQHAAVDSSELEAAFACSVVPVLNPILRKACSIYLKTDLYFVPEDIKVPLENHYAEPAQVGADRLVGAYAARMLYPDSVSLICVDYGTATTFDCIQDNDYLGGLICPGLLSSSVALAARSAKLIPVSFEDISADGPTPGLSTSTSMSHGFVFGFAAMTEGLCNRLSKKLKAPCFILGTGGFAGSIARVSKCFNAVKPDLLLEGLRILYMQQ
ncbi:MAG: type III pantothenate kinase [Deltaproteobacteria bacterium]|jgi:type III pantothenate kinase|nr:type III pantothenate kinase [Deltaproteobacteria bacterium]